MILDKNFRRKDVCTYFENMVMYKVRSERAKPTLSDFTLLYNVRFVFTEFCVYI